MAEELRIQSWVSDEVLTQTLGFVHCYDDRKKEEWYHWKNQISFINDEKRKLFISGNYESIIKLFDLIQAGYVFKYEGK